MGHVSGPPIAPRLQAIYLGDDMEQLRLRATGSGVHCVRCFEQRFPYFEQRVPASLF